jgi:hypothetical protein
MKLNFSRTTTISVSYISTQFLECSLLIALMMEAASTSETLVNFYQSIQHYNPEDSHLHTTISFTRKTNGIYFNYKLCKNLASHYQYVKDLSVLSDCKLYFYQHTDYIFSQDLKMLGLIQYITSSLSTLDSPWFCTAPSFGPSLSMHLSSGTLLHLLTHLNLKKFKGCLQLYVTLDSLMVYVTIIMKIFYLDEI